MRIRTFDGYEREIGKRTGERVFLLAGSEYYQRNRLCGLVVRTLTDPGSARGGPLETRRIDSPSLKPGDLARMRTEGSLFSTGKLFVVSALDKTPRGVRPEILDAAESPGDNAFLFITDETSLRTSFLKGVSSLALTFVCYPPFERDMWAWCRRMAAENGVDLTDAAVQMLVMHSTGDLSRLADSVGRLALYYLDPDAPLDEGAVADVIEAGDSTSVFTLLDLLMDGKTGEATRAFWELLERGEDVVGVLSFLYSQWLKLQQVRELVRTKGAGPSEVSRLLGLRGRMLDRLTSAARAGRGGSPEVAAEAFAEADESVKTGGDPYLACARLVAVLTHGGR